MKIIFTSFCLLLSFISISAQSKIDLKNYHHANDTIFEHQEFLQGEVDELEKIGFFKISEEYLNLKNLLETKDDLILYINTLMKIKYAKFDLENVAVSEDRTRKLWFVCVNLRNSYFGGHIHIVVCKKNGKVVIFDSVK